MGEGRPRGKVPLPMTDGSRFSPAVLTESIPRRQKRNRVPATISRTVKRPYRTAPALLYRSRTNLGPCQKTRRSTTSSGMGTGNPKGSKGRVHPQGATETGGKTVARAVTTEAIRGPIWEELTGSMPPFGGRRPAPPVATVVQRSNDAGLTIKGTKKL